MGKTQAEQFRVTGNGNVIIGGHKVTLGFEFEQRFDRGWFVNPTNLWLLARKYTNSHISELDYSKADTVNMGDYYKVNIPRLNSGYAYNHNGAYGGQEAQKKFSDGDQSAQENQYFSQIIQESEPDNHRNTNKEMSRIQTTSTGLKQRRPSQKILS